MPSKTLVVIILFVTNFHMCCTKPYDKYTLFSVKPTTKEQLQFLQNCALQKYLNAKFWTKPHNLNKEVQLMLDANEVELFTERAHNLSLKTTIVSDNVQKIFDRQTVSKYHRFRKNETFDWKSFYALEDIYTWLKDLSEKYKKEVELESIGKSNEGRDIYSLAVRKVPGNKEVVIVEGGSHGNEWISVAFVTYLINQLIETDNDLGVKFNQLVKRYHWYLIPVLNPDGYQYNQKTDRMWRKNRKQVQGSYTGVDLNRNFGYTFGKFDTSTHEKDDSYCGPAPFSEPETRALADLVRRESSKLKYYFSFQGYGQLFIIPYSDNSKHLGNYDEMANYAKQAALRIYRNSEHKYIVGTHYSTTGVKASGDSASWVKKKYKTKYVLTIHLRDNGTYGHGIPPEEILPACREAMIGLIEIMTVQPKYISTTMFDKSYTLKQHNILIVNETNEERARNELVLLALFK